MPPQYNVGEIKRTWFATWRVERCDRHEISFPFGSGFGCGQTVKISEGYKRTLQTQLKSTLQSGLKLAGPVELGTSSSIEQSVTIGYEFTNSQEWSYTAPACEYCTPEIAFPEAVVTVWSKRPLHVPVFVSKLIEFHPGSRSEIRGNCRKDPERCHNCPDVTAGAPGTNPILISPNGKSASQIHRVVFASRDSSTDPDDLLDGMELSTADQLFFVGLDGELVSPAKDVALLCIDDVDRAIGTVRIPTGHSQIYLMMPEAESQAVDSSPPIWLSEGQSSDVTAEFVEDERLAALGVRLLIVDIAIADVEERHGATLSMRVGKTVHQWPITTFPSADAVYTRRLRARVDDEYRIAEAIESMDAQAEATGTTSRASREYGSPISNEPD